MRLFVHVCVCLCVCVYMCICVCVTMAQATFLHGYSSTVQGLFVHVCVCVHVYVCMTMAQTTKNPKSFSEKQIWRLMDSTGPQESIFPYGVATISGMLKNTGLFAEYRSLL